jgi:hypothetical protein
LQVLLFLALKNCPDFNPVPALRGNVDVWVDGLVFKLYLVAHLWLHVAYVHVAAVYTLLLLIGKGAVGSLCGVTRSCILVLL